MRMTEHYLAIKQSEAVPFTTTWMQLQTIMLSEISHPQKDKHNTFSVTWNLIQNTKKKK